MASTNEVMFGEALLVQDFPDDSSIPSENVVSAIRNASADVGLISSLLLDEEIVVDTLIEALRELEQPLTMVPLDTGVLPVELGEADRAHVTPDGRIIVGYIDGGVGVIELSVEENRDLLVKTIDDMMPKLRDYIDTAPWELEPMVEVPEPFVQEPPEPEEPMPEPEALEEPLVGEEEPVFEEPEVEVIPEEPRGSEETLEEEREPVIEEPGEEVFPELPPAFQEHPPVEEPSGPQLVQPYVSEPSLPVAPFIVEPDVKAPTVIEREKPRPSTLKRENNGVRKLRRTVEVQKDKTMREMARVQKMRDARIRRLREKKSRQSDWGRERKGVFSRVKALFSRVRGG
jgi:hypothetical protein